MVRIPSASRRACCSACISGSPISGTLPIRTVVGSADDSSLLIYEHTGHVLLPNGLKMVAKVVILLGVDASKVLVRLHTKRNALNRHICIVHVILSYILYSWEMLGAATAYLMK